MNKFVNNYEGNLIKQALEGARGKRNAVHVANANMLPKLGSGRCSGLNLNRRVQSP